MEKKTVIDQIELRRDGTIGVRFLKLLVDDDGSEVDLGYHRTSIEADTNVDDQMAVVNAHLVNLKMGRVSAKEIDRIKEVNTFVRFTKPVVIGVVK